MTGDVNNICFVVPSLQTGGMERVVSELLFQFSKDKSLKLYLILYGKNRKIFYDLPKSVQFYMPSFEFNNKKRIYSSIRTLFYLRKQVKIINPDIVVSFGEYWNNFVLISLIGLKYSIYVSDRCQPDKSLGIFHDILRKLLYPKARGIIAQTQKAKHIFNNLYHHNNIEVIGNPIREIKQKQNVIRENIVLTVGRLIRTKHSDELIKLFGSLDKANWKMIIIGDDSQKQQNRIILEKLISDLKLNERVFLLGNRTDVDNFYLMSKIFAFTSSSEGFPNVVGEAMSAGLPVVAFNCIAGPSEMITDGIDGFLVDNLDFEMFKKKLLLLMENETLRSKIGENARKNIKKYSNEKISEKFKTFILN